MPRKYEVDPEKDTRFKPGQSGNPGGVTSEQMEKRKANRDAAFELEERLLKALKKDMDERESNIVDHIRADVLKLIHVAIEREDGKPVARTEMTSPDGSMGPSRVEIVAVSRDDSDD